LGGAIKFYGMDQCPVIVLFVLSKIVNCVCPWWNHFLYAGDMDKTVMS
jgi:hypothetical protein